MPSFVIPRTNCGPTPYPIAKRNIKKNVAFTSPEILIPSCPIAIAASSVAVTDAEAESLEALAADPVADSER